MRETLFALGRWPLAGLFTPDRDLQALAARGKYVEALAALDALIAAYPSAAELRTAVCVCTHKVSHAANRGQTSSATQTYDHYR